MQFSPSVQNTVARHVAVMPALGNLKWCEVHLFLYSCSLGQVTENGTPLTSHG